MRKLNRILIFNLISFSRRGQEQDVKSMTNTVFEKKIRFRYTGILLVENGQNIIYLFFINMYSIDNDSL